jgi:hypothetical protein
MIGYNDYLWIKKINEISKEKKIQLYFLPNNYQYVNSQWHDFIKSDIIENKYYKNAPIAGVIQITNFTDSKQFISDNLYYKTIGVAFLINSDNDILIKHHRPITCGRDNLEGETYEYLYGIDEYILSSFFRIKEIKDNSLYYNFMWIYSIFRYNNREVMFYCEYLLLFYILNTNKITEISYIDFFKNIELLRNSKVQDNLILNLILSIYPNKYKLHPIIFSITKKSDIDFLKKRISLDMIFENIKKSVDPTHFVESLEFIAKSMIDNVYDKTELLINLYRLKISCLSSIYYNSYELDIKPYLDVDDYYFYDDDDGFIRPSNKSYISNDLCKNNKYFSGYYNTYPLSLNFGLLRSPDDLSYAIDNLYKNNYEHKLIKTEYKFTNKNKNLCKILNDKEIIIIKKDRYHISNRINFSNEIILELILKYKDIDDILKCEIFNYNNNIKINLIFKALNYSNYDIDPIWYNYIYFIKIKTPDDFFGYPYEEIKIDFDLLDGLALKLSEIKGWSEYVINLLINFSDADTLLNIEELYGKYNKIPIGFNYEQFKIKI